ncbi:hypothetical protein CBR_g51810 [Chara braunii]|uniref:Uncharacterized protein n=1 Tax=Chara braunii TaxID=69332 RepID=A0A388M946_CHABU|nr:hypothetical protein CBR_g51810 [Chara braunii]|eukprot:GBG91076.1 hypothetical protein CBR_g51810 [Chara braunii]
MDREARSPPAAPTDAEEDNTRLRELSRRCYEDGVMTTNIDPGVMSGEGREVRFKVNRTIDEVKIDWLKEHTVTVIFREGARFLSRKVKEDIVRAFEDEKVADGSFEASSFSRGRVKIESPNVLSYVAKNSAIATWLILKGRDELSIGSNRYVLEFKPWLTKAQLRLRRQEEDDAGFWVVAVQVPLDAFFYLEAQVARAIGPVLRTYPAEQDRLKPALINIKFDIDPTSQGNMKDRIRVDTCEGDELEVRLASSETPRCRRCRAYFHTEADCRRNRQQAPGESSQQGHAATASRPLYQGVMGPVGSQEGGGSGPNFPNGGVPVGSGSGPLGSSGWIVGGAGTSLMGGVSMSSVPVTQQAAYAGAPLSFLHANPVVGRLTTNPIYSPEMHATLSGIFQMSGLHPWLAPPLGSQFRDSTLFLYGDPISGAMQQQF